MKRYTKAQRHEIYKKALVKYKHRQNCHYSLGLCWAISESMGDDFDDFYYEELIPMFPEFAKFKPKNGDTRWWPMGKTAPRIAALKAMIEQTKPKRKI